MVPLKASFFQRREFALDPPHQSLKQPLRPLVYILFAFCFGRLRDTSSRSGHLLLARPMCLNSVKGGYMGDYIGEHSGAN